MSTNEPVTPPDPKAPALLPDAVIKSFERLLDRHGNDSTSVGLMLFDENKSLRDQVRTLQGMVPPTGALVLSAAEASDWNAYRALGNPADLQRSVTERGELQGKLDAMERDTLLTGIAEAAGFKSRVLANLDRMLRAQGKELAYSMRETVVDGKAATVAYVKDGTQEEPLADYATREWQDFLPALAAPAAATGTNNGANNAAPRFPTQHVGSSAASSDLVTQFLNEQNQQRSAQTNPLLKQ